LVLADHRARDPDLRDAVAAHLTGRAHVRIVDLACGTGSNLRALAPAIAARQSWRLVDHDAHLLDAARMALASWNGPGVRRRIDVSFIEADLTAFPCPALAENADLVTAAAFFDLVSERWIARFCEELARKGQALYAALTYGGQEVWSPPHPADAAALAAFHAHQTRDKGFGPAAGPNAAAALTQRLEAFGYRVSTAYSPWRLDKSDAALIEALADGAAKAVAETETLEVEDVERWRLARRRATACDIGHVDLFARPG
jgi:SAM-dependent methyltransferase